MFVEFAGGERVELLIDTGFNGALCVPRHLMPSLELERELQVEIFGVGTQSEFLDVAFADILWFNRKITVEVLINDGDDRLLGSEMLAGKILTVNYESGEVIIAEPVAE